MGAPLKNHYVAFIDILGFSYMVRSDCEGGVGDQKNLDGLINAHQKTKEISSGIPDLGVWQFSDSIVISAPYAKSSFEDFSEVVIRAQNNLLFEGIMCRGGVAVGKHYSNGSFLFGDGLIEAYRIECKEALFPRVAVSQKLIDLAYPDGVSTARGKLVKESDGIYFLDYIGCLDVGLVSPLVEYLVPYPLSSIPSVRKKQLWLLEYYNFCFPEHRIDRAERFLYC